MKQIQLLDCTLRDGGFVNDWDFGFGSIKSVFSRLDSSGIDIIEVGFIDERRPYDENRTIFPDVRSIAPIFRNIEKPRATVVGMIDYGTCSIDKVCPRSESCIDGIRVIFKKADQDKALELLSQIKAKGYLIFVNPVSITSYSDEELVTLIEKINRIEPAGVSLVDTYGLLHTSDLLHYFNLYNDRLTPGIMLGYHAHNNFQMAYANSLTLINREISRPLIIDGSLFGMGKSAGNACIELLAMYMNENKGGSYDLNQLQEAIDTDIMREFQKKQWGYNFEYFISALHDCHPSYVHHLVNKGALSVKSVNEILAKIPVAKRLSFDKNLIESLYNDYQTNVIEDASVLQELRAAFSGKEILLVGPGKTIEDHSGMINDFILEKKPVVISVNFLNERYPIDYVFMGNAKRYSQFFDKIYGDVSQAKLICTSNITQAGEKVDYTVNYNSLLASLDCIRDNPLVLLLHLLAKLGINGVYLAGFDGYTEGSEKNYYGAYAPYLYCQQNLLLRNEAIKSEIAKMSESMSIQSITPTRYL